MKFNWPLVISAVAAAAVFLLAYWVFNLAAERDQKRAFKSLARYVNVRNPDAAFSKEIEESTILLKLGRRFVTGKYLKSLDDSLQLAGNHGTLAIDGLIVRKMLFATIGLAIGVLCLSRGVSFGFLMILLLSLAGFYVPDRLVASQGQARLAQIESGLPDAIDLLSLCVEAGLSFEAAASRVSINLDGPVAEEFGAVIGEIQLGKSRAEALGGLASRSKSPGLIRLSSALLQVERLGIPVSTVLQEQAREIRKARRDYSREQAQKVTVKILAPLMLCLLPAVFIVVIGPALVQLFAGLGALT